MVLIGYENSLPYSILQPLTRNDVLIGCDWIWNVLSIELLQFYYSLLERAETLDTLSSRKLLVNRCSTTQTKVGAIA